MKRIIASLLFLAATTVFAEPAPFGLEIGKATVADAEKMYSIEKIGINKYSNGPQYKVSINQVDFEGLKELRLTFNEKNVLKSVYATLLKSQFESIHGSLSKKYKVVSQEIPFVGDKEAEYVNGSTRIFVLAEHLNPDMRMIYVDKELSALNQAGGKAKEAAKKKAQEDQL